MKSNSESELSVFQKLCFAFGGLPYQMCGNALGLFIQPFLLEVAGVSVAILFLSKFNTRYKFIIYIKYIS